MYCTINHLTMVLKLSMDLGRSPQYQVNVAPLRDVGKTWHRIASSLVQRFACVRKASRCSFGSVVPLLLKVKWLPPQRYVYLHNTIDKRMPTNSPYYWTAHVGETQIICNVASSSGVWFPLGASSKVWADCSLPWGRLTQACSWSWSAYSFVNSVNVRHY